MLDIFLLALKGESISVENLANEYCVSKRSITRDINALKAYLADHREEANHAELDYNYRDKTYVLRMDGFLRNEELLAVIEVLIGSRAFRNEELLSIIGKLKAFATKTDRDKMDDMIRKEIFHYQEVKHDCTGVIDNIWKLASSIEEHQEITINYYKMNRENIKRKIRPQAIIFSEYYFYLVAFHADDEYVPVYYRVDRIVDVTVHRTKFHIPADKEFNDGTFRKKIQFMWPGKDQKVVFEFTGPSVQAILDRIPTARIIEKHRDKCIVEADVLGAGIKMYLLSQGKWVRVLKPQSMIDEMMEEIRQMQANYETITTK